MSQAQKLAFLREQQSVSNIAWHDLQPNDQQVWLTEGLDVGYDAFIPLGTKEAKATRTVEMETIFRTFSNGVKANRDDWVYDFDRARLAAKMRRFIETYNNELDRWKRRENKAVHVDDFVLADDTRIKWSEGLKAHLARGDYGRIDDMRLRKALYRPFCRQYLYFDRLVNERVYQMPAIFPIPASEIPLANAGSVRQRASSAPRRRIDASSPPLSPPASRPRAQS